MDPLEYKKNAEFIRHRIVVGLRFIVLDYPQQRVFCPPRIYLADMLAEVLSDDFELARAFEENTGVQVLTATELPALGVVVGEIESWIRQRDPDQGFPGGDEDRKAWEAIRNTARELLKQFAWEGDIDPMLFQWFDSKTGKVVIPKPDVDQ